jgi:hypothetical protein
MYYGMAKPLLIMLGKALGKLGANNQLKGQGQGQAHSMTLTSGVADLKIYIQRTFFVTITSV